MKLGSGGHKAYEREDGALHDDQRKLTWAEAKDTLLLWSLATLMALAVAGIGMLYKQQGDIKAQQSQMLAQIAVLIANGSSVNAQMSINTTAVVSLQIHQAELQREMEDLKRR